MTHDDHPFVQETRRLGAQRVAKAQPEEFAYVENVDGTWELRFEGHRVDGGSR